MRMRRRNNLEPRMEACRSVWIQNPEDYRGKWCTLMEHAEQLRVEIGCGKGKFTVETAAAEPNVLLIAVERVKEALVLAMEKAVQMGLKNVYFISLDAAEIETFFAPSEIDLMYINFCDPWPRSKNAKRRLTYHTFLEKYRKVLKPEAEIHFKTDNEQLFAWSLEEFAAYGYPVKNITNDLHANGPVGIMTGYEEKFYSLGVPIHRCEILMPACKPALPPEADGNRCVDAAG